MLFTFAISLPILCTKHSFPSPSLKPYLKKQKLQLLVNKQPGHSLPSPNTHTRQQNLLLLPSTFTQPRTNLPRARRTQRMAQRNRSAPHVQFRMIDIQRVETVYAHRGECFVEFNNVDVGLEVEVVFGEELGDREGGTDPHYSGGDAGDGGADEFGEDGLVEFEGAGAAHEEDGGSCGVVD